MDRHRIGKALKRMGMKEGVLRIYDKYIDVKSTLEYFAYKKDDAEFVKVHGTPHIYSIDETLEQIQRKMMSVCRFGDGEINLIDGHSIGFQQTSQQLSSRLLEVLSSKNEEVMVCIPGILTYPNEYSRETRLFWNKLLVHKRKDWYEYLDLNRQYGNADMTRCYICLKDKAYSETYFRKLKALWKEKNILLIEGEQSRLGVGNDLFSQAETIKRILCPAINAFEQYEKIIESAIQFADKTDLILIALGPTATILAYDLAKLGYRAIDIGNVDNEYEWYLAGVKKKVRNPLKFSMEVRGGANVEECLDAGYLQQIVKRI